MDLLSRVDARSDKEQDRQLLVDQSNRCAICLTLFSKEQKVSAAYAVDHCHVTGKVRGLLCHCCNKALGGFKDNTDHLRRAVHYLTKFEENQ